MYYPRYPNLLYRLIGAWSPCLGNTGFLLKDYSGLNNHGVLTGMEVADWVGSEGRLALDFDGTNAEYISFGNVPFFSFGNTATDMPFSVSGWVKMDDATLFGICGKASSTSGTTEWIFLPGNTDDKCYLVLYDNDGSNLIYQGSNVAQTASQGIWTHYAATYDGSGTHAGITLYKNGEVLPSTGVLVGTYVAMHNTSQEFSIGRVFSLSATYSNGLIDDVLLWRNRVLTGENVRQIFQLGRGIWADRVQRVAVKVAAAGFKSAWAAGSNVLIQPVSAGVA